MRNHDDGNISTRQTQSKKLRIKKNNKKKRKIDVMNKTTTTTIIKDATKKRNEENDTIAFVIKGQLTPIKPLVQKNVVKRLQKNSYRRNNKSIIMASTSTTNTDKSLQETTSSKIEAVEAEAENEEVKVDANKSSVPKSNKKTIKRKSSVSKLRNQDLDLSIQRIIKKYAKKFNIKRVNTKEKPTRKKKDDKQTKSSLASNNNKSRHVHQPKAYTTNNEISLKKSQSLSAIKIKEERIDEDFLTTSIKQEPNLNENEEEKNTDSNKVLCEIKRDPINDEDDDDDLAKKELEKKKINAQKLRLLRKKSLVSKEAQKQMDDKRRVKLLQFWNSPKRRRVASLNASAKVHCLYENESKSTINKITEHAIIKTESLLIKKNCTKTDDDNNSEEISSDSDSDSSEPNSDKQQKQPVRKSLRNLPGLRAIGKHWEDDTMSSDDSEIIIPATTRNSRIKKEIVKKPEKINNEQHQKKCTSKRKPKQEVYMDLKDMVVKKRMASLNASAILAASYSTDKKIKSNNNSRSSDSSNYDTDSSAEEYFAAIQQIDLTKNAKRDIIKQEIDDGNLIEVHHPNPNNNVAVILNQDTDVTITGVYVNSTTRSTHHEGFCSIAGMQYRISATSHTQTAATTVSTETLLQSGSSSDNNAHSDVQSCSSKSYTPLDALSNMQPPPGPGIHGHPGIPCQPIPQMASPSSHIHRAAGGPSAFSSPHHHSAAQSASTSGYGGLIKTAPPPSSSEESPSTVGFIPGYYQPAGPLISVSHHGLHHSPLSKSVPLSDTSPTTSIHSSSVLNQHHSAAATLVPPAAPSSNNGDSSDNEVIITSVTAGTKEPGLISGAAPPQSSVHHSPYRYPSHQYPQYHHSYPCPSQYHYQTPPPPLTPPYPPSSHDLMCYTPTSNYLSRHPTIKFAPSSNNNSSPFHRYSYYPPPHIGHTELYARQNLPPTQQPGGGGQQQQLVSTAPVTVAGNYPPSIMETYHSPSSVVAPPPTLVDAFQPTAHYYSPTAYGISAPPCYSHSPSRAISYINAASYQHCPCPLNTCPKNGHTGPLTGELSKRSNISKDSKPLPPVALAIPLESVSGIGPPSPARGSAGMPSGGMPPPPSPAGANYQQQQQQQQQLQPQPPPPPSSSSSSVPKQELIRIDDNNINKIEKRKARVGKANVRNTMQNNMPTNMLLMLNPTQEFVKCEIHSPNNEKDHHKDIIEESDRETLKKENILKTIITDEEKENVDDQKSELESKKEIVEPLPPCIATVAENVKVKNMKRKQSQCKENNVETVLISPPAKKKKITSYKDFIRKHTSCFNMNIGKKKLVSRTANKAQLSNKMKVKTSNKKKLNVSKERTNNQRIKNKKNNNKKFLKRSTQILNNLIATKNNIDRVIDDVINSSIQREEKEETYLNDNNIKKTNNNNNNSVIKNKQNKIKVKNNNNRRKSTNSNGKTRADNNNSLQEIKIVKKSNVTPKWSNGWIWEGESYESKVFINSDEVTMIRRCYPSMRHKEGDLIQPGDCVLLKAGPRKNDLPYVAKIAALWENPDDGEMMMSLLWYYRPEHTEQGRVSVDQPDEVFASRHKDSNSVACIDDKCYVLTFNEYCRYKKTYRRIEEGLNEARIRNVPLPVPYPRLEQQPPFNNVSPDMVFFCRKVYDFRQKRIIKNPT